MTWKTSKRDFVGTFALGDKSPSINVIYVCFIQAEIL